MGFSITAANLSWINGAKDDPEDLCLHGHAVACIAGKVLEYDATISAAALYLLKSLTEDHIIYQDNQMLPCCGFMLIADDDLNSVTICGCPNGIDWSVKHDKNDVILELEDGTTERIPLEEYTAEVFRFADMAEDFYRSCSPKILPDDSSVRDGYTAFWNEWHRRRGQRTKMTILIDADDVLEDMTQKWVVYLNHKYGTSTRYEDIAEWDMTKSFPPLTREQVYGAEKDDALYESLEPLEGAVEYVKKLIEDGHTVYIVTATPYEVIKSKTEKVIFRFFPFLTWKNVIVTSHKQMIKGDVLIDDGVHNLIGGDYKKILMDAPYNKAFPAEENGIIRVHSWAEIYRVISDMCG